MSNNLPSLLFVDAMVGATAYAHPLHGPSEFPFSASAMALVRRAQVDIYCSHNSLAMSAIRAARRSLLFMPTAGVADTLVALDEAAWFTRHNDFLHAEEALENALTQLRALSAENARVLASSAKNGNEQGFRMPQ